MPNGRVAVTREGRPGISPNLQMFAQDCSEEELRARSGLFLTKKRLTNSCAFTEPMSRLFGGSLWFEES
jgi:hypothetical protein